MIIYIVILPFTKTKNTVLALQTVYTGLDAFLEARKNGPGKTSRMDLHILDAREKMRKKGAGTWKNSRMDLATA